MSRVLPIWIALILSFGTVHAQAQADSPPEVKGIKIAVPMARGKASWGTKHLTKALRKYIKAGTGTIVSSRDFKRAQNKLGQKGNRRYNLNNLAKAGRRAGADYVLSVKVTKKGWEFTAHAILVSTVTGQNDMDFRSGYFKPKVEGKDRGQRIGKTTLGKIAKLINEGKGPPPKVAAAPKPPADTLSERIRDEPKPPARTTPPPVAKNPLNERLDEREAEPAREAAPARQQSPAVDELSEKIADESEPNEQRELNNQSEPSDPEAPRSQPRLADNISTSNQSVSVALEPDEESTVASDTSKDSKLIHFRVAAGSNFAHTYKLSSSAVENSGLSYPLNAMSLFASHLQVNVPGLPLSVMTDINFVPVRLKVSVDNSEVGNPSASLLDILVGLNYAFNVTDSGISVAPGFGVRLTSLNVDTHPGPIVLSSSSLAPVLLAKTLIPLLPTVDISVGIEAGYVASFEESPFQSGAGGSKGGYDLGGQVGLFLWLSDMVAITVHLETIVQQINLSGAPNRQFPPNEILQDPTVTVFDARGAIGVELRI